MREYYGTPSKKEQKYEELKQKDFALSLLAMAKKDRAERVREKKNFARKKLESRRKENEEKRHLESKKGSIAERIAQLFPAKKDSVLPGESVRPSWRVTEEPPPDAAEGSPEYVRAVYRINLKRMGVTNSVALQLIDKIIIQAQEPTKIDEQAWIDLQTEAKGAHPELWALLQNTRALEMPTVNEEDRKNFHSVDQLFGMAKHESYSRFGDVIGTTWERMGLWRGDDPLRMIGKVSGNQRPGIIRPFTTEEDEVMQTIPPNDGMNIRVANIKRFMIFSADHFIWETTDAPEFLKVKSELQSLRIMSAHPDRTLSQNILSGMITAISFTMNTMLCMLHKAVEKYGAKNVDAARWKKLIEANKTFIALVSSQTNLDTFGEFNDAIKDLGDPVFQQQLKDGGFLDLRSERDSEELNQGIFSPFDPKFFQLTDNDMLDIDTKAFDEDTLTELRSRNPYTFGCPAKMRGVVMKSYAWVQQVAERYLLPFTEQFAAEIEAKRIATTSKTPSTLA
jgi:hypothetical protein